MHEAAAAIVESRSGTLDEDELLADIVIEMAAFEPRQAVKYFKSIDYEPACERAVAAVLQSALKKEGMQALEELASLLYASTSGSLERFRLRLGSFFAFLEILQSDGKTRLVAWAESQDSYLGNRLRAWQQAETDPEAALAILASMEEESMGARGILVRAAEFLPDRVLAIFRQRRNDFYEADPDVMIAVIGAVARHDLPRALRMIQDEPWAFEVYRMDARAEVAGVAAESDWHRAISVVRDISDDYERSKGLSKVLKSITANLTAVSAPGAYAAIITEVQQLRDARARRDVYRELIESLLKLPLALPTVTAAVLAALARGDRENFLLPLAKLVRLVCKGNREATIRLEAELIRVEALLSA